MSRRNKKIRFVLIISLCLIYAIVCFSAIFSDIDMNEISVLSEVSVSRIESWPHGIRLAHWRDHNIPSNNLYNSEWERIARGLHLDTGLPTY